ncbi:MAG: response regulator [Alkalispirochaetaceae bacterium]
MSSLTVVVVEDEVLIRKDIALFLQTHGCEVLGETGSGEEAITLIRETKPDLVFLDIRLKGAIGGVDVAREIQPDGTKVVFMSAYDPERWSDKPENVIAAIEKPIRYEEIVSLIKEFGD